MNGTALQDVHIVITEIEFSDKHGRIFDAMLLRPIVRGRIAFVGHRHQDQPLPLRILAQLSCLVKITGDGFLDHHMDAARETCHGVLIVQAVRRENQNAVRLLRIQHFNVIAVPMGAVCLSHLASLLLIAHADRSEYHRLPNRAQTHNRGNVLALRHAAAANDGNANRALSRTLRIIADPVDIRLTEHFIKWGMGIGIFQHCCSLLSQIRFCGAGSSGGSGWRAFGSPMPQG